MPVCSLPGRLIFVVPRYSECYSQSWKDTEISILRDEGRGWDVDSRQAMEGALGL